MSGVYAFLGLLTHLSIPVIPVCPSLFFFLFSFLIIAVLKGLILRKRCVCCLCMFSVKFVSGLILWFFDNLWPDDLRAE